MGGIDMTIEKRLARLLKEANYKKQKRTWRKRKESSILVVNLQCSAWGSQHYINLGIYYTALGHLENPYEYDCHMRLRMGNLPSVDKGFLQALLENDSISENERCHQLEELLQKHTIPFLEKYAKMERLKQLHKKGYLKHALIVKELKTLLEQ